MVPVLRKPNVFCHRGEGVGRCTVKASLSENGQSAHCGEDDENPEEHAVHYHGNILPVFLQLEGDRRGGWNGGKERKIEIERESIYRGVSEKNEDTVSTYGFIVLLGLKSLGNVCDSFDSRL